MKLIFIVFASFFISDNSKIIDTDYSTCSDFKSGKFELLNKKTNKRYLIQRSNDFQIEETFDLSTNKKISKDRYYKILWKSNCQYILLLDLTKSQHDETDKYINSHGGYLCTIKKIEGKCAIIETQFEGDVFASEICKTQ
ncbi:hypothetical protein REB14_20910 [Chryseobacterium sp. ES2]|uniref:Uncharacterized protein n=1 Tax=Chryseobacterium metallicongregator TaxID=3073042 RepID=A0ABU1E9Z6_9FLAO|nr:hypothetical protein [Chryseobacterium sp. ES2]MDR4954650.1 hypothetical protein [Chryseobacterium sp. ES2]